MNKKLPLGPLKAVYGNVFWVIEREDGQRVANTLESENVYPEAGVHAGLDMSKEYAHLFAAAPEMLEALENLENDRGCIPWSAWNLISSAIAKARNAELKSSAEPMVTDFIQGLKVDAERFRFISDDCESSLEKIYGEDWLSVVDERASILKRPPPAPMPPMMRIGERGDRWDYRDRKRISAEKYNEQKESVDYFEQFDDAKEAMIEVEISGMTAGDAIRHQNDIIVDLVNALTECLPCLGWSNETNEGLVREHIQGNGYALTILKAREALANAKGES